MSEIKNEIIKQSSPMLKQIEKRCLAIEKKTTTKEFNIGSGVETSVNEISRELCKIIGSDAEPIHGDAILGEVQRIYLDSGLAKKELGWESETSLGDGLRKTIRWFENSKGQ